MVAGKGGVGKTTVTAAMARASADLGLRVLVVTLNSRQGLSELLGGIPSDGSDYEGTTILNGLGPQKTGSILLRSLTASDALQDYLGTQTTRSIQAPKRPQPLATPMQATSPPPSGDSLRGAWPQPVCLRLRRAAWTGWTFLPSFASRLTRDWFTLTLLRCNPCLGHCLA